jgi:hypothetical protein
MELNSESIIIDNCVVTKFRNIEGIKGIRICKISWFENKIGRSSSSLIRISSGSKLYDNLIITDLVEGKIDYDEVMDKWTRGRIFDLIIKYKNHFKIAR